MASYPNVGCDQLGVCAPEAQAAGQDREGVGGGARDSGDWGFAVCAVAVSERPRGRVRWAFRPAEVLWPAYPGPRPVNRKPFKMPSLLLKIAVAVSCGADS